MYIFRSNIRNQMKASSDLHTLIRSMSMNEKRHFRILSSRHTGKSGNSYIQLFDRIACSEIYDEQELKKGLDKAGRLRFATEKNYLQNLIIDSLIHFHRSRPSIAVYQKLISIDVLYEKKMFKACLKQVRKGKIETLKLEKLFPALSFIRWEAALLSVTGAVNEMDAVIEEERRVIALLEVQAEMMQYSFRIRNLLSSAKVKKDELERIATAMNELLVRAERAHRTTFLSIYYYHSAIAMIAGFYNSHVDRKRSYILIHEYLRSHEWFIPDIPHIYNNNLNNIVNACISLEEYKEAMSWIKEQRTFMQQYKVNNEAMSARVFLNTHENEVFIYSRTEDYQKGIPLVKSVEAGLKRFGEYYQGEQYDLMLSIGVLLFGGNDLRGAARIFNRIASVYTGIALRPEVTATARLMLLLIQFRNKEPNMAYHIRAAKRWFDKNDVFRAAEHVLRYLTVMSTRMSIKDRKLAVITEWKKMQLKLKDPNEMLLVKYFDFAEWIRKSSQIKSPD